ncbi:hypothetical protein [Treponema pedis]|uniref:hypothetical protein n=1 Tax=Treponema pedis TaxID=409322 RepID=UPI00040C9253|nr:hypothetical protein [Treponema pedis]
MKKIILIITFIVVSSVTLFAQMAITYDPANFFVALDNLYAIYDQIKTNVEQLKLQYERMQQAAEAIKGFKFEEMSWDGNWDFRNEVRDFTKQVDRQLSNIRMLQNTMTGKHLRVGGKSFSIADLVGAGDANKTIVDFTKAHYDDAAGHLKTIRKAFEEGLTDAEYQAYLSKYGLRPGNYKMLQHAKLQIRSQIGRIIAANSEIGSEEWAKAQNMIYGPVFTKALGENASPKQVQQAVLMHQKEISENINFLRTNLLEIGEMIAWKIQKEEIEEENKKAREKLLKEAKDSRVNVSAMFLGGNSLRKR